MACGGADVPAPLKCFSCWAVAAGVCGIIGAVLGIVGFIFSFWYWAGGVHAIVIIISGIIAASSGFSSCCCVKKCKTCSVVGTGIAAGLSIVGVLLLAIPYSWCHTNECPTYDVFCTEVAPHLVDPDVDSSVPNGLVCYNDAWSSCGNRWCAWIDEDCGGDHCEDDCAYWSFSNEEDCNEYASSFIGWLALVTILCVVFGWALIFITSLGAAITGCMAPAVKDIDTAGGAQPQMGQVVMAEQPAPVVGSVVIQQPPSQKFDPQTGAPIASGGL